MAIRINFDTANNPESPTLILATRDGNRLGQIEAKEIELSEKLIGASEITFIVNKYVDGRLTNLWDKIVDFKLVYCKEWDVWFEIRVEIDEDTKTVKTVFGTQLAQAELSQLMLYNIEINTEADIARDDYKISVLYDEDDHEASILHRLFEKAPHYRFGNIDGTIAKIQRSFSFDETSIYDALQEIAEEIGCLFIFHSGTDKVTGEIERYISVHDLEQCCQNVPDCGYRGEFTDVCPKCGSTNIRPGYGDDTTIFVTADELASNNIQFVTDTDSVKNCFKLEAGDDLMTATIRNCNPNGTDYIWYFSDSVKQDMSEELRNKLAAYDAMYQAYQNDYEVNLDSTLRDNYNTIVNKYKASYQEANKKELKNIPSSLTGYSNLMNAYYDVIDLSLYLESEMMPTVATSGTTAAQEVAKLNGSNLINLAVTSLKTASLPTVNSVALGLAKVFVRSTYKVEVNDGSYLSPYVEGVSSLTWRGSFTITNYSDKEDTATTGTINLTVKEDTRLFTQQKIEKALNKEDTEDYGIIGLFEKSVHLVPPLISGTCNCAFCSELKKYALKPLTSFRDACQACIDILIEQGATKDTQLYNTLYKPYWFKLKAIEAEIKIRDGEITAIDGAYDKDGNLVKKGLASEIEKLRDNIQDALNFEAYIGEALWNEFCSYRREDKYKNENYISDGLNNAELFTRALEFIDVANNEIYKSSELQHSISSTLKNLMAIEKFKPLAENFEVGNWMRVQLDDTVYKLRLLEYTIDFENIQDIPVVFSDVSKVRNGLSDLEDLFSQASSMTSHYDAVLKQASKGQAAQGTIEQWLQDGLNSALVQINNNNSEEVTITENGILCRSYDVSTDSYSLEQLKLTHNILAYTNDDWQTVRQAIGKHLYMIYDDDTKSSTYNTWKQEVGFGMSADFVTTGYLTGSTIVGGKIYSENYRKGVYDDTSQEPLGTYIDLGTGKFSFGGERIVYDGDKLTLQNVTIEWANTNKPEMTDISGLDEYIKKLESVETQIDGKAETWYQSTDPSVNWTTNDLKTEHIGDLWYYTGNTGTVNGVNRVKNSEWIWQKVGSIYQWYEMDVPDDVYDLIDGKSSIYTTLPSNPEDGDLLIPSSNIGTQYLAGQVYKYNAATGTWVEISYASDTSVNYAKGVAEAAQELGNKLVGALGYDGTKITGTYLYSPVISGGSLLMGSKDGIYAEIDIQGNIMGNSVKLHSLDNDNYNFVVQDGWVKAGWNGSRHNFTVSPDGVVTVYGSIHIEGDDSGGNTGDGNAGGDSGSGTTGGTTDGITETQLNSILSGYLTKVDYNNANHICFGASKGTNSEGYDYFLVDAQGALTARNAVIYGSVYANAGHFMGNLYGGYKETVNNTSYFNFAADQTSIRAGYRDDGNYNFVINNDGSISMGYNTSGYYNLTIDTDGNVTVIGSFDVTDGSVGSGGTGSGLSASDKAYLESIKSAAAQSATNASGYASNASSSASSAAASATNAAGYASNAQTQYNNIVKLGETNGYVAFGVSKGTNSTNQTYFCVESSGLFTARNAVIYGTVYASAGQFTGALYGGLSQTYNYTNYYNFVADSNSVKACYMGYGNYNFVIGNDGTVKIGRNSSGNYNFVVDSSGNVTVTGSFTVTDGSVGGGGSYELSDADKAYLESIKSSASTSASNASSYASNAYGYASSASTSASNASSSASNASGYATNAYNSASSAATSASNASGYASNASSSASSAATSASNAATYASNAKSNYDAIVRLGETNGYVAYAVPKGINSGSNSYFCVSATGLLEARNAVIRGKIYASEGEFFGKVQANEGSIGGWTINSNGMFATKQIGTSFWNSYIYAPGSSSDGDINKSVFLETSIFKVDHGGNVQTFNLNVAGTFTVNSENITIQAATNDNNPDAFKINRDIFFTAGNGMYSYDDGANIIRQVSDKSEIRVGNSYTGLRLFGTYIHDTQGKTISSDLRLKNSIQGLTTINEDFFIGLKPVNFKYNNGTSGRTHCGFIAQEVRDAALNVGMTTQDIAAFVSLPSEDENMEEEYALRYEEFIALNTHMIQKCLKEIDSLKVENESLKQQLQEIKQSI